MKEYYLGLDMGTSSVGWAVTNPQYELLRAKGKDLWGVRLLPVRICKRDKDGLVSVEYCSPEKHYVTRFVKKG